MINDESAPDIPSNISPPGSGGYAGGSPATGGGNSCSRCGTPKSADGGNCAHCGATTRQVHGWVYAIGRIVPQFPDLGVEKEFAQLGVAGASGGLLETNRLIDVLKKSDTAYLAR